MSITPGFTLVEIREKGILLEKLAQSYLTTGPVWTGEFKNVWLGKTGRAGTVHCWEFLGHSCILSPEGKRQEIRDGSGSVFYNIGHSYPVAAALVVFGFAFGATLLIALGAIWFGHIGWDRMLGYGLKYGTNFKHTHLGDLGKG
ncbi:hypothetical protein GCM10027022_20780 [Alpinimonas psychrophila]|uniref:DUF4260 family protein n=1 Tax=Alpinimonas psychrophila TaxID=748908 RepID=A0A7W3JUY4_9MICO|nr:DUF4260 family protein [Alpinimonas psychrophila]MBA8829736.1 hypothetical protein [Alpinimonas psychrophila]